MRIDKARRSVFLDPVDPLFYGDPYPAYHAIRAQTPVFQWEQYGFWCFARHEDVNALLRDRRFGRQILHVATREELGWPETPAHLKPFHEFEAHSLLELEPPRAHKAQKPRQPLLSVTPGGAPQTIDHQPRQWLDRPH